jgi:hypothetical protein
VVTEQIRAIAEPCNDPSTPNNSNDRNCLVVDGTTIQYVKTGELAVLPSIRYGEEDGFWRRLQLHISIGQAF